MPVSNVELTLIVYTCILYSTWIFIANFHPLFPSMWFFFCLHVHPQLNVHYRAIPRLAIAFNLSIAIIKSIIIKCYIDKTKTKAKAHRFYCYLIVFFSCFSFVSIHMIFIQLRRTNIRYFT